MRIALVGAGALGSEVARQLVVHPTLAPAIHSVLVIDPDVLAPENLRLSRVFAAPQQHSTASLVGQPKAAILAARLQPASPITLFPRVTEIADLSWIHLQPVDLILSATDNALARVETTRIARALRLPLLDAAVLGAATPGGRVSFFAPAPHAACYLCGLADDRRADLLAFASALTLSCRLPPDAALGSDPVLSPSLDQTASLLLQTLARLLHHDPVFQTSFALRLHPNTPSPPEHLALIHSPTCPWHSPHPLPLLRVDPDQTFHDALAQSPLPSGTRIQLPWPIALETICRACNTRHATPIRLARLRRHSVCPSCGRPHQLEPLRTLSTLGHNGAVAYQTPRQLGWPEPQLFELRPSLTLPPASITPPPSPMPQEQQ